MQKTTSETHFFGEEKISRILLKIAPPVMLAQLIQALYNIVDSFFVGKYSETGLTALSIVYPIQLLMIALAVGTGVGVNTAMSARYGINKKNEAEEFAGVATPLAIFMYIIFAVVFWFFIPVYANFSTDSAYVIEQVIVYGRITSVLSFGLFLESSFTKILQANGNMRTPMIAQIIGAVINIILDPIFIFGMFGLPKMGIAGAAAATVTGQVVAALIVMKKGFYRSPALKLYPKRIAEIFRLGIPNIIMQSTYTFYILGLNLILAGFSDNAVTALGLYYKWQSFFFIPLGAMQTCIVPIISYNYSARNIRRCRQTLKVSVIFGMVMMAIGIICFEVFPEALLSVFTSDRDVIDIGIIGFRFTGSSFLLLVTAQIFPVFFQSTGYGVKSSALTLTRTLVFFVPLGYIFSRFGLFWFWLTFPVTETLTTILGLIFYKMFLRSPYVKNAPIINNELAENIIQKSRPGVIITIARQHGSLGKEIGRQVAKKLDIPFYYKEMTALAAQESGLDKEFVSNINRNAPKVLYNVYLSTKVVGLAVTAQYKIIQKIAENGSCVIVGRAGDYVLKDNKDVVRIFIQAPIDYRISKAMEVYGDTYKEAKENIHRSDKARASYYHHITGLHWGNECNYDLCIDSSCGVEEASNKIVSFVDGCKNDKVVSAEK